MTSTEALAGDFWRVKIWRETSFCHVEETSETGVLGDSVTCLYALPRKQSSSALTDQRQVRGVGRRQEGSANLRMAQRICQEGCGCPHFLHCLGAALASYPVAAGSQQEMGSDDFHSLDTFFWGFVFIFFQMSQWCLCVINTGWVLGYASNICYSLPSLALFWETILGAAASLMPYTTEE